MDFAACNTKCEPNLINILGHRVSIKDIGYLQQGKKLPEITICFRKKALTYFPKQ